MTTQIPIVRARGLYTHPNPIGDDIPAGALTKANDVVIDREGIVETRRGFKVDGTELSAVIKKFFNYRDRLLAHHGTTLSYDSDGARTWVDYAGTFAAPSGARSIRAAQSNKNIYLTSSTGIRKIGSLAGTPGAAGMYKGLDGTGATTGSSGWMTNNVQVAYRVVWGIYDANNNKILGAPSQRIIVSNSSGGTRDIDLTFTIPNGVTTSHFYQIYRSGESSGISAEPNDELQLIVEKNPSSAQITAKSVTYSDATPENLRGATLYTSPSQEGISQANDAPPLARDIAVFKNQMMFANVVSKQRMYITLISVGSPGLQVDDTITIGGVVYTGKSSETVASGFFQITTSGTASQNIDATARSLVKVINQYASNTTVYAYYLTGFNDLPGQILIEERSLGGAAFVAISSRGGAFSPELPSSGSTYTSSSDSAPNEIYIAKPGQPEAVPILNKVTVGSALANILRIIALRGSVFVLKEDGVFRITGETVNDFRVEAFDTTTVIQAEDSAVEFNNSVMCYADQGVVRISDSGVEIVSRAIELTLLQLSVLSNFASTTFGVSYESDRKYVLALPSDSDDSYSVQQYVYNALTSSWTRWTRPISAGIVNTNDGKLYFGDSASSYAYQERKSYYLTDYADEEYSVQILTISGLTLTLNTVSNLEVGMTIAQLSSGVIIRESIITAVDTGNVQITVTDTLSWDGGAATVYKPITSEVAWAPIHGGAPAVVKQFAWFSFLFAGSDFDSLTGKFQTNLSPYNETVSLVPQDSQPWGAGVFGGGGVIGWGGGPIALQPIPTTIPREMQMSNWLIVEITGAQALKSFASAGIVAFVEQVAEVPAQK